MTLTTFTRGRRNPDHGLRRLGQVASAERPQPPGYSMRARACGTSRCQRFPRSGTPGGVRMLSFSEDFPWPTSPSAEPRTTTSLWGMTVTRLLALAQSDDPGRRPLRRRSFTPIARTTATPSRGARPDRRISHTRPTETPVDERCVSDWAPAIGKCRRQGRRASIDSSVVVSPT